MKMLLSLLGTGKIKLIILAVGGALILTAVISGLIYVRSLKNDVKQLTEDNNTLIAAQKILEHNNQVLKENQVALEKANSTNLATITALRNERAAAERAIKRLSTSNANNTVVIDRLTKRVDQLLLDPASDGVLAPVLKETIRGIQGERAK